MKVEEVFAAIPPVFITSPFNQTFVWFHSESIVIPDICVHTLLRTQTPFNHWPLHRSLHIDCRVKGRLKLFSQASKLLWSSTWSDIAKICSKVCEAHPVQLEIQLTTRLLHNTGSVWQRILLLLFTTHYYQLLSLFTDYSPHNLTNQWLWAILFSEARALEIRNPSRCDFQQTQWDMFWVLRYVLTNSWHNRI